MSKAQFQPRPCYFGGIWTVVTEIYGSLTVCFLCRSLHHYCINSQRIDSDNKAQHPIFNGLRKICLLHKTTLSVPRSTSTSQQCTEAFGCDVKSNALHILSSYLWSGTEPFVIEAGKFTLSPELNFHISKHNEVSHSGKREHRRQGFELGDDSCREMQRQVTYKHCYIDAPNFGYSLREKQ